MHLLIVEDNSDNMELITWLLDDWEYTYDTATSAEEGLKMVYDQHFDAILMDIGLPGMDGAEATRILRKEKRFESLPVIAVTAHAVVGTREQFINCGISEIVTKPIDENELLAVLHRIEKNTK